MSSQRLLLVVMVILMLAAGSLQAAGDPARGEELGEWCADCHGDDSLGDDDVPAIGGMDEVAMLKELMAFKSGERVDELEDMVETVEELTEQDLADLAAYFSALPGPED